MCQKWCYIVIMSQCNPTKDWRRFEHMTFLGENTRLLIIELFNRQTSLCWSQYRLFVDRGGVCMSLEPLFVYAKQCLYTSAHRYYRRKKTSTSTKTSPTTNISANICIETLLCANINIWFSPSLNAESCQHRCAFLTLLMLLCEERQKVLFLWASCV